MRTTHMSWYASTRFIKDRYPFNGSCSRATWVS